MGWSESYYSDMKREAEGELRKGALPLLGAILYFREALEVYGEFINGADELQALLRRLELLLGPYR